MKWTDRFVERPADLRSLISFCTANRLDAVSVTSRTASTVKTVGDLQLNFTPTSLYCFTVGYDVIRSRTAPRLGLLSAYDDSFHQALPDSTKQNADTFPSSLALPQ